MSNINSTPLDNPKKGRKQGEPAASEQVESVTFRALDKKKQLDTPELTALLTINSNEFEVGTTTDRFITVVDNLFEQNPHGKVSAEQFARAFNANNSRSGLTNEQIEEVRELIRIYREAVCVFSFGDDIITTVDNHLVDITREQKRLRINHKVVDEYYYIHRPSLVKLISQEHPDEKFVTYVKIPYNWLDMGFRATQTNNALIFLLSKAIATKAREIDIDSVYRAGSASSPKQQLDTRRKTEKLLDKHRDKEVTTPLYDYVVLDKYGEQTAKGLKDPDAKIIKLQYENDNGE